MLTPTRLAHPRRQPSPNAATDAALAESASHLLEPRPKDLGASWPAHAHRCRQQLPADLAWAAPLLDPQTPTGRALRP
jgi:hypothetical protein